MQIPKKITFICTQCRKIVKDYPSNKSKFCNRKCYFSYRIEDKCYQWKGGRRKINNYIMIHKPSHPYCNKEGYILEHRFIMEKTLNRYLNPYEIIHHINGIRDDNRLENLIIMTRAEHNNLHKNKY